MTANRPLGIAKEEAIKAKAQRTKWAKTCIKPMPNPTSKKKQCKP